MAAKEVTLRTRVVDGRRRPLLAAAAVTGLLCVVALTSGPADGTLAAPSPPPADAGGLARGAFWAGISATIIMAVVVLCALAYTAILPHRGMGGGAADPGRDPSVPRRVVAFGLAIVAVLAVSLVAAAALTGGEAPAPAADPAPSDDVGRWFDDAGPADPPSQIGIGAGVLAMALLGAVVLVRARRRRYTPPAPPPALVVSDAVNLSIDDLLLERDPRRAIVAAYARMERMLAGVGAPRRPHETPYEYLRGVLAAAAAPSNAVWQLTQLFQEARFSRHPITAAERDEALDALIEIKAATDR